MARRLVIAAFDEKRLVAVTPVVEALPKKVCPVTVNPVEDAVVSVL